MRRAGARFGAHTLCDSGGPQTVIVGDDFDCTVTKHADAREAGAEVDAHRGALRLGHF
jgi:hypothetical protein